MGVNSLPNTLTRQRRGSDLNPGPFALESRTLTTRLPSHPTSMQQTKCPIVYICRRTVRFHRVFVGRGANDDARCSNSSSVGRSVGWSATRDTLRLRAALSATAHRHNGGTRVPGATASRTSGRAAPGTTHSCIFLFFLGGERLGARKENAMQWSN